jgi:hypothetical protein
MSVWTVEYKSPSHPEQRYDSYCVKEEAALGAFECVMDLHDKHGDGWIYFDVTISEWSETGRRRICYRKVEAAIEEAFKRPKPTNFELDLL